MICGIIALHERPDLRGLRQFILFLFPIYLMLHERPDLRGLRLKSLSDAEISLSLLHERPDLRGLRHKINDTSHFTEISYMKDPI